MHYASLEELSKKKLWQTIYNSNYTQKCLKLLQWKMRKILNVWPKKIQRSYLSWHWWVIQIWRKTDLWFENWHDEYGKFLPEQLKVSKLIYWWDPLMWSRKSMSWKSTDELCVMTMKYDAKFQEELTCHFKIDLKNLINFDQSTWKSRKFSL